MFRARLRFTMLAAVGLVAATILVGCSSGGTTLSSTGAWLSDSARAELRQIVDDKSKPLAFEAPGKAIDVSTLSGKRVYLMANQLTIPFAQVFVKGLTEAAEAAGMTVTVGDGNSQVSEQSRLIEQAVAEKYDAIIVYATNTELVNAALLDAKKSGIPIITTFEGDPALPEPKAQARGVVAESTYCYGCAARLAADYALLTSDKPVHAKLFSFSGVEFMDRITEAYKDEIAKYCDICTVDIVDLAGDTNTISQRITSATTALLTDGQTNTIHAGIDTWLSTILPTISAGGADDRIMLTGFNGSSAQLNTLQSGSAIKADIGSPVFYAGYAAMDQAYRALLGSAPLADEKLGMRIFSTENIGGIDLNGPENSWYGSDDIGAGYRASWGLE